MKKVINLWIFASILLCNLFAQQYLPKASLISLPKENTSVTSNEINILAVMVEFQEDNDGATFGNGTFGSIYKKNYGKSIIDPLPHDKAYFESHLLFAKNYFTKASNGKVNVNYTVLSNTFKVTKKMRDYSPLPKSTDFSPLGDFSKEVWQLVVAENPNFDFSQYDLFAIFHAGVGRDINLPGSLGNERDLPSVYLSQNQLKKIFGADFVGFPANNALISNTIILPETESREISSLTGDVLLELSINGLIVSSIASHLGLPDLFDTNTGLSAIGRFGLMDGQAIFAYSGLFPPEPSAWEKIYLGWETPTELKNSGIYDIQVAAKLAASLSDTKIVKIPINNNEYFLVENRQRDVNNDGITLTIDDNGNIITKSFPKDTTGFGIAGVDSVQGVIIDVDEYDWAVPGNGIVIWHIDESVINQKIVENKINTDKFHRGIDVEEADGIQDIGEEFFTIFGDKVIGEGEDVDMWYLGNKSKLYKNRFAYDTKPNSLSYSGANSLVTISDFSPSGNFMTFKVTLGNEFVNYNVTNLSMGNYANSFKLGNQNYNIKDGSLFKLTGNTENLIKSNFTSDNLKIAINNNFIVGAFNQFLNIYSIASDTVYTIELNNKITTSPVITADGFIIGVLDGKVYKVSNSFVLSEHALTNNYNKPILQVNGSINTILYEDAIAIKNEFHSLSGEGKFIKMLQFTNQLNEYTIALSNNKFYVFVDGKLTNSFYPLADNRITNFIIAQVEHNGLYQILFTDKNKIWAYNISGSVCDGFPISYDNNVVFEDYIFAADFDSDSFADIMFFSEDGNIFLYSLVKKSNLYNFPVSTGSKIYGLPTLIYSDNSITNNYLLNLVSNYKLYEFNIASGERNNNLEYLGYYGKLDNNSDWRYTFSEQVQQDYFPEGRAYNWPNPVYGNSTFIRYYVKYNSNINIKIFDLAGALVDEINTYGVGGNDNEVEWNVSKVQSGVYFARIEANGDLGNSGSKIIKIAVIK